MTALNDGMYVVFVMGGVWALGVLWCAAAMMWEAFGSPGSPKPHGRHTLSSAGNVQEFHRHLYSLDMHDHCWLIEHVDLCNDGRKVPLLPPFNGGTST